MLDIIVLKTRRNSMPDRAQKREWIDVYKFVVEVIFDVLKYYLKIAAFVVYVLVLFIQGFIPQKYHIKPTESRLQPSTRVRQSFDSSNPPQYDSRQDVRKFQNPLIKHEVDGYNPKFDFETDDFSENMLKNDKQFVNLQLTQAVPQEGILVNFQVSKDGKLPPIRKMEMYPLDAHQKSKIKYGDEDSARSHHNMRKGPGPSKEALPNFQSTSMSHMSEDWNHNVRDMLKKKTSNYQPGPPQVEADESR